MSRRHIIVLLDGTSCSATEGFRHHFSNVFRVGPALAGEQNPRTDHITGDIAPPAANESAEKHIILYFPGPGTRKVPLRQFNALTGYETNTIVKEAYLALCTNTINPSLDKIYIIGFSRGAAAAKILVALIAKFGLLSRSQVHQFGNLWSAFHDSDKDGKYFSQSAQDLEIEFVGLFDPVSGPQFRKKQYMIDPRVSENVVHAIEIMSIDERRRSFFPRFWMPEMPKASDVVANEPEKTQKLQQIWIPGGHSNVGHPGRGNVIADIAFLTMIERLSFRTELKINLGYTAEVYKRLTSGARSIEIDYKGLKILSKRRKIPSMTVVEIHPLYFVLQNMKFKINGKLRYYMDLRQPMDKFKKYHFDSDHICSAKNSRSTIFSSIEDVLSQEHKS